MSDKRNPPPLKNNDTENISDAMMSSPREAPIEEALAKINKALNSKDIRNNSCRNILFVESNDDREVYVKFVDEKKTNVLPIDPKIHLDVQDYYELKKTFTVPNCGKDCNTKDAIICIVARNAHIHVNYPSYPKLPATFYGLVDMDFDKDKLEIEIVCDKIKEDKENALKQITTTNPANDLETLLFKYKDEEIKKLVLSSEPSNTLQEFLSAYWINLLEMTKRKTSKLGSMRKKAKNNHLNNCIKKNNKENRPVIKFEDSFRKGHPEDYLSYLNYENSDEDTYLDNLVRKILTNKNKERQNAGKQTIDVEQGVTNWKGKRNTPGDIFMYCRGHDFTGILACLIQKNLAPKEKIGEVEHRLMKDIRDLVKKNDSVFDGADFKEFFKENAL